MEEYARSSDEDERGSSELRHSESPTSAGARVPSAKDGGKKGAFAEASLGKSAGSKSGGAERSFRGVGSQSAPRPGGREPGGFDDDWRRGSGQAQSVPRPEAKSKKGYARGGSLVDEVYAEEAAAEEASTGDIAKKKKSMFSKMATVSLFGKKKR
jgi:hypothetical protein